MSPEEEVNRILHKYHAVLKRSNKHNVWQFPNGQTFVTPKSPSDHRSRDNNLSYLKRLLGLNTTDRGQPGERRVKYRPNVPAAQPSPRLPYLIENRDAMKLAGLVRATLSERISALVNEMRRGTNV